MSTKIVIRYDCGAEYEVPVGVRPTQDARRYSRLVDVLTLLIDEQHDRECQREHEEDS